MDVLSDAVTAMRTGRPHAARNVLHAPWATRFPPTQGAGFHVLLQGSGWLLPRDGEPVALGVGDVVFLPRGLGHAIADDPTTPAVDARPLDRAGNPPGDGDGDAGRNRDGRNGEGRDGDAADTRGNESSPFGITPVGQVRHGGPGARTVMLCGAYRLDQSRAHPLLAELPGVVHVAAHVGRHPSLRGAIDLLGLELAGDTRPGGDAVLPALLDVMLLYILRAWYDEQPAPAPTGWGAALRDPAVGAALRALHQAPDQPWTVQSLGARAGLSRAAFARRFADLVGVPPLGYLTWWRMTIAARLLRDGDLPLRAVAERAGYTSEFAFAKAFKREFGLAPGRYRAERPAAAAGSEMAGSEMTGSEMTGSETAGFQTAEATPPRS